MYMIEVTSREQQDMEKPYEIALKIIPENEQSKKELTELLQQDEYYLISFINPIMWLFNGGPMYVYIEPYKPVTATVAEQLRVNEEIVFRFAKQSHAKYFEQIMSGILTRFIDKKLAELEKAKLYRQEKNYSQANPLGINTILSE